MESTMQEGLHDATDRKPAGTATEGNVGAVRIHDLSVLDHLMAGGQMLATQHGSPSSWSPEKKLAAAVFASALVEIRDHHGDPSYNRRIAEDVEWIFSDDEQWPFSFLRLCDLMDLAPVWVREVVTRWMNTPRHERERPNSPYRQAA